MTNALTKSMDCGLCPGSRWCWQTKVFFLFWNLLTFVILQKHFHVQSDMHYTFGGNRAGLSVCPKSCKIRHHLSLGFDKTLLKSMSEKNKSNDEQNMRKCVLFLTLSEYNILLLIYTVSLHYNCGFTWQNQKPTVNIHSLHMVRIYIMTTCVRVLKLISSKQHDITISFWKIILEQNKRKNWWNKYNLKK
jgi:hypothetical protein